MTALVSVSCSKQAILRFDPESRVSQSMSAISIFRQLAPRDMRVDSQERRDVIPEPSMNPTLSIPTEPDWGDYRSDLDQEWAHRKFAGKSNDEMQQHFREIPIEAASDLRFMPEIPFRYYMLGFRDCLMSGGFEPCNNSDAASCFLHLVTEKLETQPRYILPIMPELIPAVEHIAHNQATFDADESIYGSFLEILKQIQELYANAQDTNRPL